jgi:hypothetical protein
MTGDSLVGSSISALPGADDHVVDPAGTALDPLARPFRRTFTAEYRARVVAEYEAAQHGEKSAVLRREGLYQSPHPGDLRASGLSGSGRLGAAL